MTEPVLTISHLTKQYDGQTVLDGIDLEVHEGEVIVIVGPSGSGKSTLLRCINALEDIQGGEVRLHGRLIKAGARDLPAIRQKIGMVFQSYELFPHLTVMDNILLAPMKAQRRKKKEVKEEAMTLLTRVGLADKADSYPRQLSGGQKQRVAIVRALCMHPEILLFDEPTSGLDYTHMLQISKILRDLKSLGKTVIVVTHDRELIQECCDLEICLKDFNKI